MPNSESLISPTARMATSRIASSRLNGVSTLARTMSRDRAARRPVRRRWSRPSAWRAVDLGTGQTPQLGVGHGHRPIVSDPPVEPVPSDDLLGSRDGTGSGEARPDAPKPAGEGGLRVWGMVGPVSRSGSPADHRPAYFWPNWWLTALVTAAGTLASTLVAKAWVITSLVTRLVDAGVDVLGRAPSITVEGEMPLDWATWAIDWPRLEVGLELVDGDAELLGHVGGRFLAELAAVGPQVAVGAGGRLGDGRLGGGGGGVGRRRRRSARIRPCRRGWRGRRGSRR